MHSKQLSRQSHHTCLWSSVVVSCSVLRLLATPRHSGKCYKNIFTCINAVNNMTTATHAAIKTVIGKWEYLYITRFTTCSTYRILDEAP